MQSCLKGRFVGQRHRKRGDDVYLVLSSTEWEERNHVLLRKRYLEVFKVVAF